MSSLYSESIEINSKQAYYNLGHHVSILVDQSKLITAREILEGKHKDKFVQSEKEIPNFGINYSNFWVKVELRNTESQVLERIIEINYPLLDHISYYSKDRDENLEYIKTGDMTFFSTRPISHQNFLFPVRLESEETKTIYFFIQSKGSIQIPLILWEKIAFIEDNHVKQILLGLYYGTLIVMIAYNLFLYISIRDKSYLYYVIYICWYLIFQSSFNGFFFEFIIPTSPIIANILVPMSIGCTLLFASLFTRNFLQTKNLSPFADKFLFIIIVMETMIVIASPIMDYKTIVTIATGSALPFSMAIVTATILSLKSGYKPSRFFALAWAAFILGMSTLTLKQFGFLPNNLFTNYSMQLGSMIEVTLLSLGLGDRINMLIQEKKQAELERVRVNQINQAFQEELNNARKIQRTLMPINIPQIPNISIAYSYLPASKVGGDICGFYENTNNSLGIYIGDVSGHGIPAALISLLVKQEFDYFSRKFISPKETLMRVNKAVYTKLAGEFVTFFYCYLQGDKLLFSNAGHNPPLLYRSATKDLIELKAKGKPIGILPDLDIDELEVPFLAGDRLILYTDGLTESGDNELFGEERLHNFILQNTKIPPYEFKEKLIMNVAKFIQSTSFHDDLALLVIDRNYPK